MVVYVCLPVWVLLFLFITIYTQDFQTELFKFQSMVSFFGECVAIYVYMPLCIFMKHFIKLEIIRHPFVQVHCLDFSGSCVSSSQLSVNGSGYEDEPIFVFDHISLFHLVSSCLPHYISWPMVYWPCFTCSRKETRDLDDSPKLCSKFLEMIACAL